jgi:hypothetical protein
MRFLKPNSVSGEIMNLFDEANEKVVIVSPYCKFEKWFKLKNKIKDLQSRNIEIEFYIREGEKDTFEEVRQLGIEPKCIQNLHAKLYLNEKCGIVTSMNLLLSSEISSIELGYKTENAKEYLELIEFYNTYLKRNKKQIEVEFDWRNELHSILLEKFRGIRILESEGSLQIKTSSNNYNIFIWNNNKENRLRMSGILSGKEFDYAKTVENNFNAKNLEFELVDGSNRRSYDAIWSTLKTNLKTCSIYELHSTEIELIIHSIVDFITRVEDLKDYCYKNRKELP